MLIRLSIFLKYCVGLTDIRQIKLQNYCHTTSRIKVHLTLTMNIPQNIEKFIDESPVSLVADKGGPLSLSDIQDFYDREVSPLVKNKKYGKLCLAGLMFAQDYIWEAHEIVQDYPEVEASWWHAFMHRMEGDYGNSAYWYRRVGAPSYYGKFFDSVKELSLVSEIAQIQNASTWDPLEFNGLIKSFKDSYKDSLHKVHLLELKFLFAECLKKAS